MRSPRLCSLGILALITLTLLLPFGASAEEQSGLEITIYYSPKCGSCQIMHDQIVPPLLEQYGDRIQVQYVDVSDAEGLQQLEEIEERLGQGNNPVPVVVIENDMILTSEDVFDLEQDLIGEIERRLAQGEVAEQATTETEGNITASNPGQDVHSEQPLHVAYVEKAACDSCARASLVLEALREEYPTLQVTKLDVSQDADLVEAMGAAQGLSSDARLIAPALFVGDRVFHEDEITLANLRPALADYRQTGSPAFWEQLDPASGRSRIIERFQSMGPLAVVIAALIDGINPCAFATIIFFVSYLAISQHQRRGILIVGFSFAAGVFVAYLAAGLGAMRVLHWVTKIQIVGPILYGIMALGCFILAVLSLRDYRAARRGRLEEMSLNLPEGLRRRIHGRLRRARGAVASTAFVSGLFVSLLELACTGQVYLPTISFIITVPDLQATAIAYLILYNLVFVLPLILILLLVAYGISSNQLQTWFQRRVAMTKLALAGLFLILGFLLSLQLFSV